jgi:S-formylglutathione hydrolase FrmB
MPVALTFAATIGRTEEAREVASPTRDEHGVFVHRVWSNYQSGETCIHVLLPDSIEKGREYPVLYVLPVEAGEGKRWGDALDEVRMTDIHNKHQVICVYPTFSHLPWYADHPVNPSIRQESHFLRVVLPFIERSYPAMRCREGRYLVGFSKSGWGAFSLLLRHADIFARAAAWDAPLMEERPERFGMEVIFGTQENFAGYRVEALLRQQAGHFGGNPRLILTGFGNFRSQHAAVHDLMVRLGIAHVYRDGPKRPHNWHSGWLAEAVELMMLDDGS